MMTRDARFLAVAAFSMLLVFGLAGPAAGSLPLLRGLEAEAGDLGPVIHISASGKLDTVHYSPQPGVWVVEMPEADWEQEAALLSEPGLGIERAELSRVDEFGRTITRLTVWLSEPAQLDLNAGEGGLDLRFQPLERVVKVEVPMVQPEQIPADELSTGGMMAANALPETGSSEGGASGSLKAEPASFETDSSGSEVAPATAGETSTSRAAIASVDQDAASNTSTVPEPSPALDEGGEGAARAVSDAPIASEPSMALAGENRVADGSAEPGSAGDASAELALGSNLLDVAAVRSGDGVVVQLLGDGAFEGVVFTLDDPVRVVADLKGVVNRVDRHLFAVNSPLVRRVRVAQFRAVPEPITRIVVDLEGSADYRITGTEHGAVLSVGSTGLPEQMQMVSGAAVPSPSRDASRPGAGRAVEPLSEAAETGQPAGEIATVDDTIDDTIDGTVRVARSEPEERPGPMPEPSVSTAGADAEPAGAGGPVVISNHAGQLEVYDHETEPAPASTVEIKTGAAATQEQPPVLSDGPVQPRFVQPERIEQPEPAEERRARNPWVADPSQLIERAAAADALQVQATDGYATTEIESEERKYTGDPISITVKDADIKDVLRTFSTLTNLNIVLDPEVRGSVTVELRNVPWDQALDLILRINGLDYVLENNVLRVATTSKLAREKQELARLLEEKERAKPLRTVIKPLSYAKASTVASLLSGDSYLLSPRGSVVVDDRTNTLIIRDVVDRVEGVLKMIETLDQPTPQVVIEARIVETTKDFSHTLGLSWGFDGVMDSEHGNDTGIEFPNSVDVEGRVNLSRGGQNGLISLAFGDILNTFNLDMLLAAAENDGLVKIVSTPRVTTQNLTRAQIRSGLQIPVQTVSNNTVTVQYVDATLTLQVTPQITAEGTVLLEVDIRKQEPVLAAAVVGGTNSPIFTRDAQTQLLVRDGGTTVIAGIYQINDQQSEDRVPGLAKIPILGTLFKNRDIFKRHDELLIFITPRIVKY